MFYMDRPLLPNARLRWAPTPRTRRLRLVHRPALRLRLGDMVLLNAGMLGKVHAAYTEYDVRNPAACAAMRAAPWFRYQVVAVKPGRGYMTSVRAYETVAVLDRTPYPR